VRLVEGTWLGKVTGPGKVEVRSGEELGKVIRPGTNV
jgi:hypothetical protein